MAALLPSTQPRAPHRRGDLSPPPILYIPGNAGAAKSATRRTVNRGHANAMNYRHAYHAGNFADVVKHAVLCRVLTHLRDKPAPFRIIDTHAGAGIYDLAGPEAGKTGEWRYGIGRLLDATLDAPVRALLAPYLDTVAALNPDGRLVRYPGSPLIAQALLRPQDRLTACELEPRRSDRAQACLARRSPHQRRRHRWLDRTQCLCAAERTARPRVDRPAL